MMTLHPNQKENDDHREMMEEVQRSLLFVSKPKACTEQEEMEQDSGGSSEEMESPRSVGRWRRRAKRAGCVHSQILRIREEDAHLGFFENSQQQGGEDLYIKETKPTSKLYKHLQMYYIQFYKLLNFTRQHKITQARSSEQEWEDTDFKPAE